MNDKTTAAIEAIMGMRDEIASANTMRAIAEQQRDEAIAERDNAIARATEAESAAAEGVRLLVEESNKEVALQRELRDANEARDKAVAEVARMRQEIEKMHREAGEASPSIAPGQQGGTANVYCLVCETTTKAWIVGPNGWRLDILDPTQALEASHCPNCKKVTP